MERESPEQLMLNGVEAASYPLGRSSELCVGDRLSCALFAALSIYPQAMPRSGLARTEGACWSGGAKKGAITDAGGNITGEGPGGGMLLGGVPGSGTGVVTIKLGNGAGILTTATGPLGKGAEV